MSLPESVPPLPTIPGHPGTSFDNSELAAFCSWAARWGLDVNFAVKVARIPQNLGFAVEIISGFRTDEEQLALMRAGKTNLGPDRSNHCTCPARAADLWIPGVTPTDPIKALFGAAVRTAGLRWGGGSPSNDKGIPSDWNHVDEGPRGG